MKNSKWLLITILGLLTCNLLFMDDKIEKVVAGDICITILLSGYFIVKQLEENKYD